MRILIVLCALCLIQCSGNPFSRNPAASQKILDKSGYLYDPADTSCDGFPRLAVETLPGTCLGLVLPRDRAVEKESNKSFIMPRTLAQVPGTNHFLVVDMGGWKDNNGSLYLLRPDSGGKYGLKLLKAGLNKPHGLHVNSDGFVYLGETHRISRFRFTNGQMGAWELVIDHLPRPKGDMHPLTQFTFDPRNNDLFLNTGAPTDHCYVKNNGTYSTCPDDAENGMAAIYRIPGEKLKSIPAGGIKVMEVTATGLRNSMAMAVHPSGTLVQGENGRDFPELEEPFEEINVIDLQQPGFHYGWPYCYNFHGLSPEWKFPENATAPLRDEFNKPVNCDLKQARNVGEYQAPHALIPPHAAPLHAGYYQGAMFGQQLNGKLIMTWHGYQPTGHRLVAYGVDEKGRPLTVAASANATYSFDTKGGCPVARPIAPAGGADRIAPYTELISRWDAQPGLRPRGAPVGFTVASDGSIWIAEDKNNRTIVRLARTDQPGIASDCDPANSNQLDPRIELLAWRHHLATHAGAAEGYGKMQKNLAQRYCTGCHANFQETAIAADRFSNLDFFVTNGWLQGKPEETKLYGAIAKNGSVPPMPPEGNAQFLGTPEGSALIKSTADWLATLPTDPGASIKRIKLKEGLRIRDRPGTNGTTVCGQFEKSGVVYLESSPKQEKVADGFVWVKAYVVPGDSRLFKQLCKYPEDGVFYTAIRKTK